MKSILCPIDYSNVSDNALDYACNLALKAGARITLLHAYHIPVPVSEAPLSGPDLEFKKINDQTLTTAVENLKKQYPQIEFHHKLSIGFAKNIILDEADSGYYDLIVMGISGAGSVGRYLIGSSAIKVSRKSPIPVLIIPEKVTFKSIEKIVFATDLKDFEDSHNLDGLLDIVDLFNSEVLVAHVVADEKPISFEKAVTGVRIESKFKGRKHSFHFAINEDVIDGLKEYSTRHHAGMIAMLGHEHNFLYKVLNKTHVNKMAYESTIPLLSLPYTAKESVEAAIKKINS